MTNSEFVLAAAPYDTKIADAMRQACGVFARRQWPSRVIDGNEYDEYMERLRATYDTGE